MITKPTAIQMNTNKIAGRLSAGVGVIEELSKQDVLTFLDCVPIVKFIDSDIIISGSPTPQLISGLSFLSLGAGNYNLSGTFYGIATGQIAPKIEFTGVYSGHKDRNNTTSPTIAFQATSPIQLGAGSAGLITYFDYVLTLTSDSDVLFKLYDATTSDDLTLGKGTFIKIQKLN